MKVQLFPATTRGYYRLESFSHMEAAQFARQIVCAACGCDSESEVLAFLGGNTLSESLKLVCCRRCGHISYDRLPAASWLDYFYSRVFEQAAPQWTFRPSQVRPSDPAPWGSLDHVQDLDLPRDSKILDFGCGYGLGLKHLQKLGYTNVFGVELGERRAEVAKLYLKDRVKCGSLPEAEELARENGMFDLIVLHHVLEHLRDPYRVLTKLASLLTPGGVIAVAVPEIYSESPVHLPLYFPHLHHFNTTSMMRLMSRVGLMPYRWTRSKPQLAVVGSPDATWSPSADAFCAEDLPIDEDFTKGVRQFVGLPWQEQQSAGPIHVSYFHPWMNPEHPSGFQRSDPRLIRWINLGRTVMLPMLALDRKFGPVQTRFLARALFKVVRKACGSAYQAFFKVARMIIEKDTIINSEVVGFTAVGPTDTGVPWLTMPNGDVPVLVK
jgi:2-polyprenyl-3-methyl-5-hydroxy-6-metoxy-1,4-benzoquinol methylase